jgi:hypothetical protein
VLSNSKVLKTECVGESTKLPVSCYTFRKYDGRSVC